MISPSRYSKACALDMRLAFSALGDGAVHELDPERVQAVARHEVIFPGFTRGRGFDALGESQ